MAKGGWLQAWPGQRMMNGQNSAGKKTDKEALLRERDFEKKMFYYQ